MSGLHMKSPLPVVNTSTPAFTYSYHLDGDSKDRRGLGELKYDQRKREER